MVRFSSPACSDPKDSLQKETTLITGLRHMCRISASLHTLDIYFLMLFQYCQKNDTLLVLWLEGMSCVPATTQYLVVIPQSYSWPWENNSSFR